MTLESIFATPREEESEREKSAKIILVETMSKNKTKKKCENDECNNSVATVG